MNSMWAFIIRTTLLLVVPMASSELFTDDASIDSLKETRIIGGSEVSSVVQSSTEYIHMIIVL